MTTHKPNQHPHVPQQSVMTPIVSASRQWQSFLTGIIIYCISLASMVALVIFLSVLDPDFLNKLDSWGHP